MGELTEAVGMAQPAVSHQLRVLRDLGLVVGAREGRHTVYDLFDPHVAMLLDEALRHIEHLRLAAVADPVPSLDSLAGGEPGPARRSPTRSDQPIKSRTSAND